MARTPLELGTPGRISIRELKPRRYEARCRFRDLDGVTRLVSAQGTTRTAAQNALLAKLTQRPGTHGVEVLKPHHRFADAAALWLAQIEQTQRGTTHQAYQQWLTARVLPDIGQMRLRELRAGYLDTYFLRLRAHGYAPNTRRMIRKVVRGPLELAALHEAVPPNLTSAVKKIEGQPKPARALTLEEQNRLRTWLDGCSDDPAERAVQEQARRRDLPDIIKVMLGTGLRVGELMALRWRNIHLDGVPMVVAGVPVLVPALTVEGNVARVRGQGVVFHEGKTANARRTVPLPAFATEALQARREVLESPLDPEMPVFGVMTPTGVTWRDPNKVTAWVRDIRDWVGLEHMTTHTWRKTAATILDEAGLSARLIADQMGHAQISMTQNVYLARQGFAPAAADALEAAWRNS